MKAYRVELLVLDFVGYGAEEIRMLARYARGLSPAVMAIDEREIGPWDDSHPLNHSATQQAEFDRLFKQEGA